MRNLDAIKRFTGSDCQLEVNELRSDSRAVSKGDVFVAVRGQLRDGRKYIGDAVRNGAAAVIYENSDGYEFRQDGVECIGVSGLDAKLPEMASVFYDEPSKKLKVVGITGTNGKSSTAYYVAQLFAAVGIKCGIVGTVGNGFVDHLTPAVNTTPGPVEVQQELLRQLSHGARYVAMEVSSHGIAQGRIRGITFAAVVFTNISRDHLDFHKTFEAYFGVKKGFILENSRLPVILNSDDKHARAELLPELKRAPAVVTVGSEGSVGISEIAAESAGTSFTLARDGMEQRITLPLIGAFNVYNAVEAFAAVRAFAVDDKALAEALRTLKPLKGRMEIFRRQGSPLCLVDYAHTPDGIEKALTGAREHTQGRLISVVGCGGDRDRGKRPMMAEMAASLSDYLIITDDNPRTEDPQRIVDDMLEGKISCDYEVIHDRRAAIVRAVELASVRDTVVVAGKGHEDYQIIGAVKHHFSDQEVLKEVLEI